MIYNTDRLQAIFNLAHKHYYIINDRYLTSPLYISCYRRSVACGSSYSRRVYALLQRVLDVCNTIFRARRLYILFIYTFCGVGEWALSFHEYYCFFYDICIRDTVIGVAMKYVRVSRYGPRTLARRGGGDVDHRFTTPVVVVVVVEWKRWAAADEREKPHSHTLHFWRRHDRGTTVAVLARYNGGSRAGYV